MTTRQRSRLIFSFKMVVLTLLAVWHPASLLAQTPEAPPQVWRTPAEASQAFLSHLFVQTYSRGAYSRATEDYEKEEQTFRSIISQKSFDQLKESGVISLLSELRNQLMIPRWEAETGSERGGTSAPNAGDATVQMRAVFDKPVVCVQEGQAWRVDLVATYARWNQLSGEVAREVIERASENARRSSCQSNLKQLALGILQYAQDYDENYPPANKWCDVTQPYVKSEAILNCPSLEPGKRYGYAMNWKLSRKSMAILESPAETILLYESSVLKRNHSGEGKDLAFRHLEGANYLYADGHVKWHPQERTPSFLLSRASRNSVRP